MSLVALEWTDMTFLKLWYIAKSYIKNVNYIRTSKIRKIRSDDIEKGKMLYVAFD